MIRLLSTDEGKTWTASVAHLSNIDDIRSIEELLCNGNIIILVLDEEHIPNHLKRHLEWE